MRGSRQWSTLWFALWNLLDEWLMPPGKCPRFTITKTMALDTKHRSLGHRTDRSSGCRRRTTHRKLPSDMANKETTATDGLLSSVPRAYGACSTVVPRRWRARGYIIAGPAQTMTATLNQAGNDDATRCQLRAKGPAAFEKLHECNKWKRSWLQWLGCFQCFPWLLCHHWWF